MGWRGGKRWISYFSMLFFFVFVLSFCAAIFMSKPGPGFMNPRHGGRGVFRKMAECVVGFL